MSGNAAQVIAVLTEALEVEESALSPETELISIDTYDSTGTLGIIAGLDKRLGVVLDPDQLSECQTVGDLVEIVCRVTG